MAKYIVRYIHKIATAASCRCHHSKEMHRDLHIIDGSLQGHGPCAAYNCECLDYVPGDSDTVVADLPSSAVELGDILAVARVLRAARLLPSGARLVSLKREHIDTTEHNRLVCIPQTGVHQSLIVEPWAETSTVSGSDVVANRYNGIYRIRWCRDGRCYVTSTVNGGLIGAFVNGHWDEQGRLPDGIRAYCSTRTEEIESELKHETV